MFPEQERRKAVMCSGSRRMCPRFSTLHAAFFYGKTNVNECATRDWPTIKTSVTRYTHAEDEVPSPSVAAEEYSSTMHGAAPDTEHEMSLLRMISAQQ